MTGRLEGAMVVESDSGNGILICTALDVNMKKISSKKMISVNDDMLNSAVTLLLLFTATIGVFKFYKLIAWLLE
jgi:hypothetical protein